MKKVLLVTALLCLVGLTGFSQSEKYWTAHNLSGAKIATDKSVARQSFPKEFKLFDLNINALRQIVFEVVDNKLKHTTIISLPNVAGETEQFEIVEASNFEPALQAQFPNIRAFSGKGITDKAATLKMSISPQGIQTMIFRTDEENEFIEAYSQDHKVYAAFKSQRQKGQLGWTCSTDDKRMVADVTAKNPISTNFTGSSTGELKTMRLAQSVTAEYSNYFGATSSAQVGLVLAAINATLTRCNGVYEKDLALHLNLIASTATVIYYNATTDPYSDAATGSSGAWNGELQATLTSVIGDANYDIGHLFGASGGGGNAGCIGCVCGSGKGSGFTSPADNIPQGDNFDIDYVVHEVGHQLGGNHTFSFGLEGTGVNKEVGSGITIMGYAGITNQDVAPHSIDIFHEASIQQIQTNLATKTCPVNTVITAANATPVVAAVAAVTIPISTPFALTGAATDANAADVLTYCWEQNDNSTTNGANSVAFPTKATGPNFISFSPTISSTRLFPRLATILAGLQITPTLGGDAIANTEALSSIGRTLNFRLTVRDNSPYSSTAPLKVGQTAFTDVAVTVTASAGPFQVTSPNTTGITYPGGSTQTITWDVNNTTAAPINCANVKISYSTDGGITFPTVLAASTANDGTEALVIPVGATTTARIKIEAIGNIFFDINNANFTVSVPPNGFTFGVSAPVTASCPIVTNPTITIPTAVTGTFTTPIVLTYTAVPAGPVITFAPNPLTPGNSAVATLTNANTLTAGTYTISVIGTAGAVVKGDTLKFIINTLASITTQPVSQTACIPAPVIFTAAATGTGTTYQWQQSADGITFANIAGATGTSYSTGSTAGVPNGTTSYRVIVTSTCAPLNPITSNVAVLTVNNPVTINTQPANKRGCANDNYIFSATAAASAGTLTYQWEVSVNGGTTYNNVVPGIPADPATSGTLASYTINNAPIYFNGNLYRVRVIGNPCGLLVSSPVSLTLSNKPAVVLTAASYSFLNPSILSGLYTTVSPVGGFIYSWTKDGIAIPNTLTTTFIPLTVDDFGTYQVSVSDAITSCTATSNIIKIDALQSDRLFIYPNPVTTSMQVRYYSANPATRGATINVFDGKGAKVYSKTYSVTGIYGRMDVNMTTMQQGVYMVELRDASGKKLASASVLKKQ